MKSNMGLGSQVSAGTVAQLTVDAVNSGTPEAELNLDIMNRPEAVGNENVAYLVFGVPGTSTYSLFDLNNLPDGIKVCVTVERNGSAISKSEFSGTTGNAPQPV